MATIINPQYGIIIQKSAIKLNVEVIMQNYAIFIEVIKNVLLDSIVLFLSV
jgi:hypothetical protein